MIIEEILCFTANICFILNYNLSCGFGCLRKNVFLGQSDLRGHSLSSASSSSVPDLLVNISALSKANATCFVLFLLVDSAKFLAIPGRDASAALLAPRPVVSFTGTEGEVVVDCARGRCDRFDNCNALAGVGVE